VLGHVLVLLSIYLSLKGCIRTYNLEVALVRGVEAAVITGEAFRQMTSKPALTGARLAAVWTWNW